MTDPSAKPVTRRRVIVALCIGVVALGALRAAAPGLLTHYLNREMAQMGDYQGRIADVDLALWRGAWVIRQLRIEKRDSEIDEPLLWVPRLDALVQWRALLHGELVAEARLTSPVVNFVQRIEDTQYGENTDWRGQLQSLLPIRVNRVEIHDGHVSFLNPDAHPPVDVFLSKVDVSIANLTNIRESNAPVFTGLDATAKAMGHAPLMVRARLDPIQRLPQFDLNVDLRELDLTGLNPWLMEYANVTAESGTFSLSAEVAAADGRFEGYVKPLLDHAEFVDPRDFRERPLGAIWDAAVGALSELLENQPQDRVGTRIPVRGEIEPELELWPSVGGVLGNMFDALLQGIDDSINLQDALDPEPASAPREAR
jgi:hypothetical protein